MKLTTTSKNTKNIRNKIASGLLAAMIIGSGAVGLISATGTEAAAAEYSTASASQKSPKYYENMKRLQRMRCGKINVSICNAGAYIQKTSKFYARKAIGVDDNGNFILGHWECLNSRTNVSSVGDFYKEFKISGDYMVFAYSFDIKYGTDFPFSRVF